MDNNYAVLEPHLNTLQVSDIEGLAQKWDVLDRAGKKNDDRSYFMEIEAELKLATRTIIDSLRNPEELKR